MLKAVLDWRPKTPFYYGWLVLATSFSATFPATGVSQVVIGGVQSFILEDTGWSRSQLALAVTAGTWASAVLTPLVGRLADRHGARWLMPIGSLVAGISLIWIGNSAVIWQFWMAYILGRAVSNPVLIGVVPRTVAVNFFRRHRNLALSLISEARPVGGAIVIQLIALIAIAYDWRTAYKLLGVASLLMVVPLILIMRRRPEDLGLLPDGAPPGQGDSAPAAGHGSGRRRWSSSVSGEQEFDWRSGEALRTKAFWFIAGTAAVGTLTSSAVGFSLVPYLVEEVSLSRAQAAGILSLGTILTIANLGWAFLANRFTPRWCLLAVLLVSSVMVLYLYGLRYVAPAYVIPLAFLYALLWGLGHGPVGTLEHMMLAQFYGRGSYGAVTGMLAPLQTTALGLGPLLSAVARDLTGNYGAFLLIMFSVHLVGVVLIYFVRPPALPARGADQTAPQS
ncbi:MAG: MFS transporter [Dehalococcoidia bacterium]|nr:MFS transporter [Dehalococcoidia bacterium]MSQ17290.1 MFS transporter [Dehalococcoidia bacterium]